MFSTIASVGAATLVHGSAARASARTSRQSAQSRLDQGRTSKAAVQHVKAVWSRLIAWKMRRATRTILSSLDDRTLKDIGLERSEIDRVLANMQRRTLHWQV